MAYSNEQYKAAGQWILANLGNPAAVKAKAKELGLSNADILKAAQTVNSGITMADIEKYLGPMTTTPTTPTTTTVSAPQDRFSTDQYKAAGQYILANLGDPALIATRAKEFGLTKEELLKAAKSIGYNNITIADIQGYLSKGNAAIQAQAAAAAEAERQRQAAAEAERQRQAAAEAERQRQAAIPKDRFSAEQYKSAGDWISKNFGDPKAIAAKAKELGLTDEELLKAAQTQNKNINLADVQGYLAKANAARTFSPQQYIDVGQWLKSNIDTPDFYKVVNQLAAQEGVSREDLLKAAQTVAPGLTAGDIDKFLSGNYRPTPTPTSTPAGEYEGTVEGGKGVDFIGSSGLKEFYGPYVTDYLSRMSGLLALRDSPDYKPIKFGTEATGGTYGGETAQTLADLQTKREAMMSGDQAYKPYQYSFAQKPMTTQPAAKGGIMSLVDHYDAGGTVGNVADTVVGGANTGTPTYANQTVPSTYTAPTNTYTGPGTSGITTGSFDQNAISRFTNPYATAVTDPQVREAKRQAQLASQTQAAKFSQAGAFGGSRSILAENELGRNLATQIGDIYGKGQKEAYDAALRAFEAEEGRKLTAGVETERARQEAGRQGLTGAATEAQYQQLARDLQQRAEEAQARGDQFEASLALQQLQEANRAAESAREFEYRQARDTYLDPFRELGYANQALGGLPISSAATGISPATEALISALGLNNILNPTTKASDRRLKTNINLIGMFDDGLKVYSYRYKSGGPVHIGVMADEVAVLRPQAYIKGGAGDGFDAVDYSKL